MKSYAGNLFKQLTDARPYDLAVPFGALLAANAANAAAERARGESRRVGFGAYLHATDRPTALDGREDINEPRPRKAAPRN